MSELGRQLAAATERAERAGKRISSLMDEIDKADKLIAALTRERDEVRSALAQVRLNCTYHSHPDDASEIERLTRELEAERNETHDVATLGLSLAENWRDLSGDLLSERVRDLRVELEAEKAGAAAKHELLDEAYRLLKHKGMLTYNHQNRLESGLSSTAGAEYIAQMAAYRLALERLGCACRSASIEFRDGAYKCLRCVTLESHIAGAEMLERLRKAEATISENEDQHSENWRVKAGHLEKRVTELEAALEEAQKALDPFFRFACIRNFLPQHMRNDDTRPLRDVLPGVWPTVGDLDKAHAAHECIRRLTPEKP